MRHLATIFLLLFLLSAQSAFAVFSVRVGDPRKSNWTFTTGTVEEAVVTVKPRGLYLEYGLYLTFSARGTTTFKPTDSLEVEFKFELPDQSAVTDSWLWINDDIVRALILDRWAATGIYEETVQRRTDPSILRKNSNKDYELRIFPMRADETRRVKITYLVRNIWYKKEVAAEIPIQIANVSRIKPANMTVLFFPDGPWTNPVINRSSGQSIGFDPVSDPTAGNYYKATLPQVVFSESVSINLPATFSNGVYAEKHTSGNEQFYEIMVLPDAYSPSSQPRRVCLLIDFQNGNTSSTAAQVMNAARDMLRSELSENDRFNVIVSTGLLNHQARQTWTPAHPDSIEAVFNEISPLIGSYSNLVNLLTDGIQFIQQHNGEGDLLLIANNNQFANVVTANGLYYDITALISPLFPLHIVDFNNASAPYTFVNGFTYRGNEYLFRNLAGFTGGNYHTTYKNVQSIQSAIRNALNAMLPDVSAFDFYTEVDNGFCFGRYNLNTEPGKLTSLAQPISQIGRFVGDLPMVIQMTGLVDGQLFSREIMLNESDFVNSDSFLREMWYAQFLRGIENSSTDNGVIQDAIATSIAERVLSRYTAFICLEDSTLFCPDCFDETQLVDTGEPGKADSLLTAYPNPFVNQVHFTASALRRGGALEIFSADGRLILRQTVEPDPSGRWSWTWDGAKNVPPGVYLARLETNDGDAMLKLLKADRP